mmetsp:Transcript_66398/g.203203  ORF Transcript_66398/g.203203 Transcript_66398/m.203203 type:complete len:202 (-) Transcript_66398:635-1240(-)
MGVVAFEAELRDRFIPLHHLPDGLLGRPSEELAHLPLVRHAEVLQLRAWVRVERQREFPDCVGVQPVRFEVELEERGVHPQRLGQNRCFSPAHVRVGQRELLQVRVRLHRRHELRGDALLDVPGRHVHVGEFQLREGRVVEVHPVHHPNHPVAVRPRPGRLGQHVPHVVDLGDLVGELLVDAQRLPDVVPAAAKGLRLRRC